MNTKTGNRTKVVGSRTRVVVKRFRYYANSRKPSYFKRTFDKDYKHRVEYKLLMPALEERLLQETIAVLRRLGKPPYPLIGQSVILMPSSLDKPSRQEQQFAARFRSAWKQLPPMIRSTVTKYWDSIPYTKVVTLHPPARPEDPLLGVLAGCRSDGCTLYFDPLAVSRMPRNIAELTVIHEIVRIFLMTKDCPLYVDGITLSRRISQVLQLFSFDDVALFDWVRENSGLEDSALEDNGLENNGMS